MSAIEKQSKQSEEKRRLSEIDRVLEDLLMRDDIVQEHVETSKRLWNAIDLMKHYKYMHISKHKQRVDDSLYVVLAMGRLTSGVFLEKTAKMFHIWSRQATRMKVR